jgi:nitroreductase
MIRSLLFISALIDSVNSLAFTNPATLRRSVARFTDAPVDSTVVDAALEAAILAPNHFMSEPWRFYIPGPQTTASLCNLNPEKTKMFEKVPNWLVVTMKSENEKHSKLWLEDLSAVSCAVQNFMTSLAGEGVGSKWMTGALGSPPEAILGTVKAGEGEELVAAVWFGIPEKELEGAKAPPRKLGVAGTLTKLD